MSLREQFEQFKQQKKFNDDQVLLDFYDQLPAVQVNEILSPWQGGDFNTGHLTS